MAATQKNAGAGPAKQLSELRGLWRRNRHAVGGNNLRLVREDFAAAAIDQYLQSLHVVGAVRLIVAKCLNASEILQPAPLGIQEWLIQPEVVRVAVDIGNGLAERDHLVAQREQKVLEAIGLTVGLCQRFWIA